MLTCKQITEKASDYLDRELSWQEKLSFKMHLMICKVCRLYLKQFSLTLKTIPFIYSKSSDETATAGLAQQLQNKMRGNQE